MKDKSLITVKDFAEKVGLNEQSIYRMVRLKQIPHIKIGKRVFLKSDVLESLYRPMETN